MDLQQALRRRFGYPGFRAGQEALVRAAVESRDALGILPTGGGKSVCYMLPAGLLPGLTVVVSPLISLMEDQVERAREVGLRAALLNSSLQAEARRRVLDRVASDSLDFLLVAPERFAVATFRRALSRARVSLMAVDEAHCISAWGFDFRPSYLRLGSVREDLGAPCLALTATATPRVQDEIVRTLGLRRPERVVGSFDRPNLHWAVHRVRDEAERNRRAVALLQEQTRRRDGTAVVYASTRRTVESCRDALARLGLRAEAYHGGMRAGDRARVQAGFMGGEVPVVVATNAFGMGVDKPDVRLVLHWEMPGSLEGYYQEAGRAGRDGAPARCVAFHRKGDGALHRAFLDRARPPVRALRRLHGTLRGMLPEGRGCVDVRGLVRPLGRGWSPERVEAALGALAGAGLLRLEDGGRAGTSEGDAGSIVRVSLRPGRPDFRRARALRRAGIRRLDAVERYLREPTCRRRVLLEYFGERRPDPCGACDRCDRAGRPGTAGCLRRLLGAARLGDP